MRYCARDEPGREDTDYHDKIREVKMQSKTNRAISLAMSAAMLLTNLISPMKLYAQEEAEPSTDVYLEETPQEAAEEIMCFSLRRKIQNPGLCMAYNSECFLNSRPLKPK